MRLNEITLAVSPSEVPESVRPLMERLERALRATRESLQEVQGTVKVVRYNQPPTAPPHVAALPTASIAYLGQILQLDKNAVTDDEDWICIRKTGGAYAWVQLGSGGGGPAGPTGPKGDPGPPGMDGMDGEAGTDGAPGLAGTAGLAGADGQVTADAILCCVLAEIRKLQNAVGLLGIDATDDELLD